MENYDLFQRIKNKWDSVDDETIAEIKKILETKPGKEMELDKVHYTVNTGGGSWEDVFARIGIVNGKVVLTTVGGCAFEISELKLGESLWVLFEIF